MAGPQYRMWCHVAYVDNYLIKISPGLTKLKNRRGTNTAIETATTPHLILVIDAYKIAWYFFSTSINYRVVKCYFFFGFFIESTVIKIVMSHFSLFPSPSPVILSLICMFRKWMLFLMDEKFTTVTFTLIANFVKFSHKTRNAMWKGFTICCYFWKWKNFIA